MQARIKVGRLPGPTSEMTVDEGALVRGVINAAGIEVSFDNGDEILVNGAKGTMNTPVKEGDSVRIARESKANRS